MSTNEPAFTNRNTLWAECFVDELARSGLKHVCIAPGSRSTALTLAFARHPDIQDYVHLDERSAAFFALGIALRLREAVALVCTSGSAIANFFPAIVEAYESEIPLIVLSTDRPHELRGSGANQTIHQPHFYGTYALWAYDLALPESHPPAIAIRNLRTTANRAVAIATNPVRQGPVHLNFPFRKPLEPTPVPTDAQSLPDAAQARPNAAPYTRISGAGRVQADEQAIQRLAQHIHQSDKGIIVLGAETLDEASLQQIEKLSIRCGYPIFADPLSGMRWRDSSDGAIIISAYETFLRDQNRLEKPQVILRFGGLPISRWLNEYLQNCQPACDALIRPSGLWADDAHVLTDLIQADIVSFCQQISPHIQSRPDARYAQTVQALDTQTWAALKQGFQQTGFFDGALIPLVLDLLDPGSLIFAGNSLSVRHLDQFGQSRPKALTAYGNRGASGIDGNVSTALGIASVSPSKRLVAIMGDLTFYHDMNGLYACATQQLPVIFIVVNNQGGGIFNRLPIRNYEPTFQTHFATEHAMNFEQAAAQYQLHYFKVNHDASAAHNFKQAFTQALQHPHASLIEVSTDYVEDEQKRLHLLS